MMIVIDNWGGPAAGKWAERHSEGTAGLWEVATWRGQARQVFLQYLRHVYDIKFYLLWGLVLLECHCAKSGSAGRNNSSHIALSWPTSNLGRKMSALCLPGIKVPLHKSQIHIGHIQFLHCWLWIPEKAHFKWQHYFATTNKILELSQSQNHKMCLTYINIKICLIYINITIM